MALLRSSATIMTKSLNCRFLSFKLELALTVVGLGVVAGFEVAGLGVAGELPDRIELPLLRAAWLRTDCWLLMT